MRINLPFNTPTAIIKRIHGFVQNEKRLTLDFPQTTAIDLSNPTGIVTISGKGSDSVAAQRLFRIATNLLSQQS